MLRKQFHWIEGVVVVALLVAVAWMNRLHAAPDDFAPPESYGSQSTSGYGAQKKDETEENARRFREGTEISGQTGYFRQDGDGATFVTDDGYELGGLPNLNLERVVRTLKTSDETSSIRWRVNGTITEFSGRNYLLITRAVYKSAAQPPSPEQISILGEQQQ
jgi:hypothetical protein